MRFVGQNHIMNQLSDILPQLYLDELRGENFLFSGPSGFGKTTMAVGLCNYLSGRNFEFYLADRKKFLFNKRVIFIDEVHLIKEIEILFPIMDEKSHVLVFATNHDSILQEAFVNRCFHYIFSDYSDEDLLIICKDYSRDYSHTILPDYGLMEIIHAGNNNPRIIKSLLDRILYYLSNNPSVDKNTANYREILSHVFDIKDGIDTTARRYMEILDDLGGTSSLSMLKSAMHVDEGTLRNVVEPILLRKKLIKISQRGRSLV
jgi:Holliday junction resolvasome RuvABC ATP-dependent DNA helicase subunit